MGMGSEIKIPCGIALCLQDFWSRSLLRLYACPPLIFDMNEVFDDELMS